jgi:hypothetical protein
LTETLLAESRGVYAFNRELSGTDAFGDLIDSIENHYVIGRFVFCDRLRLKRLVNVG